MAIPAHRRSGSFGTAEGLAALGVVAAAAAALILSGGAKPAVAPAPSPLPGAPHRASAANGVVAYAPLLRNAGDQGWAHGLTVGPASGGPPRVIDGRVVCCVSVAAGHVLFTERRYGSTRDLLADLRRPGRRPANLGQPGLVAGPAVLSPDGRRFAVEAADRQHPGRRAVFLGSTSPGIWARLTPMGRTRERPLAFSPDGRRLLVYRFGTKPGTGIVDVVDIPSGRTARVTPAGMTSWCCYFGSPASWSPDGRIAFAAFEHPQPANGESAVFVAHGDGSQSHRVTEWQSWTTSARWSPNGAWIAFDRSTRAGGLHDLLVTRPDGASAHVIRSTYGADGSCCAVWAPNSRALIYESGPDDAHMDVWTTNLDGSGLFHLTTDGYRNLDYAVG